MITVNGQPQEVPEGTPVAAVVAGLAGPAVSTGRGLAVAVNGEVIPRAAWDTTTVAVGDRVEVLTASQGG